MNATLGLFFLYMIGLGPQILWALDPAALKWDRYTKYQPAVPIYVVPGERLLHRFFDTSPISPSGRYLALSAQNMHQYRPDGCFIGHWGVSPRPASGVGRHGTVRHL